MKIRCEYKKLVPLKELKPHPKNRNAHGADQVARLAHIFEYQGIRHPIIVSNLSGFIVAGHGRLAAATKLKFKEFPVDYQDFGSEKEEYAFLVSDNAVALWAELDLSGINADIGDLGPDFDIDLLGIKNFTVEVADKEGECDEDEIPEYVEPRTKLGDIYKLGNHRLMCGDSTSIDAVEKLMDGEKADMVFTDPPYGVDYEGGHNKKKRSGIEGDKLEGTDLTDLFADSLTCAIMAAADHAAFYIWYASGKSVETYASFANIGLKIRAVIAWYKVQSGLGAFMAQYIPNYEPCIYAFKDGCSPQWFGPTDEKTVWEQKRGGKNEYHPTQKPVELPERAMRNSSKQGDIVLDLFGGSGSTLMAAEKLSRVARLMELDPKYCDVIVARWEKFTGQKAELMRSDSDEVKNG